MACPLFIDCHPRGRNAWTAPPIGQWPPLDWLHLTFAGIALAFLLPITFKIMNWYFGRHTTLGAVAGIAGAFLLSGYAALLFANLAVDFSFDMASFDDATQEASRDVLYLWRKWFV